MKIDTSVPFARLNWFQEKLGLGDREQQSLAKHRDIFLKEKQRFSEDFFRYFWEIKETRIILDHERRGPHLKKLWEQWYELIFTEAITPRVLGVLWRSRSSTTAKRQTRGTWTIFSFPFTPQNLMGPGSACLSPSLRQRKTWESFILKGCLTREQNVSSSSRCRPRERNRTAEPKQDAEKDLARRLLKNAQIQGATKK
jgi:hypothetical protein